MSVLSCRGLVKRHGRDPRTPAAVDGVDLEVAPGEVVAIVGESGSGKTSLGKAVLFIDPPTSGTVTWAGRDPRTFSAQDWLEARRRHQMVYQNPFASLNPGLTVRQHLEETARVVAKLPAAEARNAVHDALSGMGLLHRAEARPHQLSGGEKRRATVARALLPDPHLLVADEPTSGLDAAVKTEVLAALLAVRRATTSVLWITHDLEVVRAAASRLLVMFAGKVVEEVRTGDLLSVEHHPYTWALLKAGRWEATPSPADLSGVDEPLGDSTEKGCAWRSRCPISLPGKDSPCALLAPSLVGRGPHHSVACHREGEWVAAAPSSPQRKVPG